MAEAGGHLLAAAISFLGEILPASGSTEPSPDAISAIRTGLRGCAETGEDGKIHLAVTLPSAEVLDALASALAKLTAVQPRVGIS